MLLEMAVADAYGIGFEFCEPDPLRRPNTLERYYRNPNYEGPEPGQYTDDTQRAIANVQVMFAGHHFDVKAYARRYLEILRASPRKGYSRGYQAFLETTADENAFIRTIKKTKVSNGSIMGVSPLGYLKTEGEVRMAASIQAITTHNHETIPYAQGVALAAHYFIEKKGPKADLEDYLDETVDWQSLPSRSDLTRDDLKLRTGIRAVDTYKAMLRGLRHFDNLRDIIYWACEAGGDTDSCAAITVAVASCSDEFEKNIPQLLIDGLEKQPVYGRESLKWFDDVLRKRTV